MRLYGGGALLQYVRGVYAIIKTVVERMTTHSTTRYKTCFTVTTGCRGDFVRIRKDATAHCSFLAHVPRNCWKDERVVTKFAMEVRFEKKAEKKIYFAKLESSLKISTLDGWYATRDILNFVTATKVQRDYSGRF